MKAFPDANHLASWAGLCPGNRESGGKRMSGRIRKANRYIKRAMCQAAWAAAHTKNTYLSAFYRRMSIRKGAPKAVIALAHHMMVVVHQVLSRKEEYVEFGSDYYDQRNKPTTVARLAARLARLGYEVELKLIQNPITPADPHVQTPPQSNQGNQPSVGPKEQKRRRGRPCKCAERGIICQHRGDTAVNVLIQ